MKLVHNELESQFVFNGTLNVFIVENGSQFRAYCEDIINQINGQAGKFTLSEGEKEITFSKSVLCISDVFSISSNDKKLITKLYANLASLIDETLCNEFSEVIAEFCSLLDKLNASSDLALDYDADSAVSNILKAFNVRPFEDADSFLNKLISYMDAVRVLTSVKLFCFINLKQFLSNAEAAQFNDYLKKSETAVLFLESSLREAQDGEFRVLIDKELCEILV